MFSRASEQLHGAPGSTDTGYAIIKRRQSTPKKTESLAQEQAGCSPNRKTLLSPPVGTGTHTEALCPQRQSSSQKNLSFQLWSQCVPSRSGYSVLLDHLLHPAQGTALHKLACTRDAQNLGFTSGRQKDQTSFYNTIEKLRRSDQTGWEFKVVLLENARLGTWLFNHVTLEHGEFNGRLAHYHIHNHD